MDRSAGRGWTLTEATQLRAMRHDVSDLLEEAGVPPRAVADVVLMTTELATNSLRYAGGEVGVVVRCDEDIIEVVISDRDPTPLPPPRELDAERIGGNGLRLVDAFATDWGARLKPEGKEVWFHVDRSAS